MMKKITMIFGAIVVLTVVSCRDANETFEPQVNDEEKTTQVKEDVETSKSSGAFANANDEEEVVEPIENVGPFPIKFKLRWSGLDLDGDGYSCGEPNGGCICPLGICFIIGIVPTGYPMPDGSTTEIGTADLTIVDDDHVKFEFDQHTGVYDANIHPTDDFIYLESNYTVPYPSEYDVTSLVLEAGTYFVDYSSSTYGEVIVDADVIE